MNRNSKSPAGGRRPFLLPAIVFATVTVTILGVFAADFLRAESESPLRRENAGAVPSPKKAAVIDQLSLDQPNPDFVEEAGDILREAGYTVDYFPSSEVTVDLIAYLPAHGYDVIILRVHSARSQLFDSATGREVGRGSVSLFTGEPFPEDGRTPPNVIRAVHHDDNRPFMAVGDQFILQNMRGSLQASVLIMMGCESMVTDKTALAFLRKGARAVVGWDGLITAEHTDTATLHLLRYLLGEELPLVEAANRTISEVGADPYYGGALRVLLKEM